MIGRARSLATGLGLGVGLAAALPFCRGLEDAYLLPQSLALAVSAALLVWALAERDLPATPVLALGAAFFAWRVFCHYVSPFGPEDGRFLQAQLPLAGLFFAGAGLLGAEGIGRKAAVYAVGAGALGAAFALASRWGWLPLDRGAVDLGFGNRAFGTLGNPDYLGGWLAPLLPVAAALTWAVRGRLRWPLLAALGLLAAALLASGARGSWLAGVAGLLAAAGAWGSARARRWALAGIGVAALLLLAGYLRFGLLRPSEAGGPARTPSRWTEAFDPRGDAWDSRRFMAATAWDLACEHPVLGVGGGAFTIEYLRRQGERLQRETAEPYRYTEDAHNDWVQCAAETGFPGLALGIALFALALGAAAGEGGPRGAAVAGALVAFGVQGCFHFPWDIPASAGLASLALGAAAACGARRRLRVAPLACWCFTGVLVLCTALLLKRVAESSLLNAGASLEAEAASRPLAEVLLKKAGTLERGDERIWSRLGGLSAGRGDDAQAAECFSQALRILPTDAGAWTNLGMSLGRAGHAIEAEKALRQAVALNPRSKEAWADLAHALAAQNRLPEAVECARRGLIQAGGDAYTWFNLGALLYNQGHWSDAAQAFEKTLSYDAAWPQARTLLKDCRAREGSPRR